MKKNSTEPDFQIIADSLCSNAFSEKGMHNFQEAARFIRNLPYGRNTDKTDLLSLFREQRGTCSTKHALLKQLAAENGFPGIRLILGLFRMHARNTPEVTETLRKYQLPYMPEAHCYLRYGDEVLDCTKPDADPSAFLPDLLLEREITPEQITTYKITFHEEYLEKYRSEPAFDRYTAAELWEVREQCIRDLERYT
ncbi:MAG: hypothetical protein IBJ09_12180 [Bacteroidia bacterium]|nr:hypothetical protein [Bacteroidia bacterium]